MSAIYDYLCEETGQRAVLRVPSIADAPPIGHVRVVDGKEFRRVPSLPRKPEIPTYRFLAMQVEDDHPRAKKKLEDGTAYFESKREVEEFCSASKDDPYMSFHNEGRRQRNLR